MLEFTTRLARRRLAQASTEGGQALVEYGLILALIAVIAIVAITGVGTGVRDSFASLAAAL
jgi:pilus assembly protein Flp/PilA